MKPSYVGLREDKAKHQYRLEGHGHTHTVEGVPNSQAGSSLHEGHQHWISIDEDGKAVQLPDYTGHIHTVIHLTPSTKNKSENSSNNRNTANSTLVPLSGGNGNNAKNAIVSGPKVPTAVPHGNNAPNSPPNHSNNGNVTRRPQPPATHSNPPPSNNKSQHTKGSGPYVWILYLILIAVVFWGLFTWVRNCQKKNVKKGIKRKVKDLFDGAGSRSGRKASRASRKSAVSDWFKSMQ